MKQPTAHPGQVPAPVTRISIDRIRVQGLTPGQQAGLARALPAALEHRLREMIPPVRSGSAHLAGLRDRFEPQGEAGLAGAVADRIVRLIRTSMGGP